LSELSELKEFDIAIGGSDRPPSLGN